MKSVESIFYAKIQEVQQSVRISMPQFNGVSSAFADILNAVKAESLTVSPVQQNTMVTSAAPVLRTSNSTEIDRIIDQVAAEYDMDPDLIRAVVQTESSYRPNVVSHCGAQGLMQLMPGTAKEMGVSDPFDPYQNIRGGTAYLKRQIERFGDVRLALAAYNTGPGRIGRLKITDPNDPVQYEKISNGVRGYVDKVMKYYAQFRMQG